MQAQIIANCAALTGRLAERGVRIPYGGTNTHLTNIDCKVVVGPDGTLLSGDLAARILDVAGIVANRNTIPGDKNAAHASGVRLGTAWITQRGLKGPEMRQIADIIADLLQAISPYSIETHHGPLALAKVKFETLEEARLKIRALAQNAGIDCKPASPRLSSLFLCRRPPLLTAPPAGSLRYARFERSPVC